VKSVENDVGFLGFDSTNLKGLVCTSKPELDGVARVSCTEESPWMILASPKSATAASKLGILISDCKEKEKMGLKFRIMVRKARRLR
jgi:hypothetical protein